MISIVWIIWPNNLLIKIPKTVYYYTFNCWLPNPRFIYNDFAYYSCMMQPRKKIYRDSLVSVVFWSQGNRTIGKTVLIRYWFSSKILDLSKSHFLLILLSYLSQILISWQNFRQLLAWITNRGWKKLQDALAFTSKPWDARLLVPSQNRVFLLRLHPKIQQTKIAVTKI